MNVVVDDDVLYVEIFYLLSILIQSDLNNNNNKHTKNIYHDDCVYDVWEVMMMMMINIDFLYNTPLEHPTVVLFVVVVVVVIVDDVHLLTNVLIVKVHAFLIDASQLLLFLPGLI